MQQSEPSYVQLMSAMVVQDDSDRSGSPERGIRCGRGLLELWDDDLEMMSSVVPLLDSDWELLSLRERITYCIYVSS